MDAQTDAEVNPGFTTPFSDDPVFQVQETYSGPIGNIVLRAKETIDSNTQLAGLSVSLF
jgi:hypothetical protein